MDRNPLVHRSTRLTGLLLLVVAGGITFGATPPTTDAPDEQTCATNSENRQLDFWLGDWRVVAPGSAPNAASRVYLTLDKCMVVESWDGGRGHIGENMLAYSSDDHSWRGMFVDNRGRVHIFNDGKAMPGAVEFSASSQGPGGGTVLNRVKIVRLDPDKVEQLWQKSSDNGITWSTEFRGEYLRKH